MTGLHLIIAEDDDDDFLLIELALRELGYDRPLNRVIDGDRLLELLSTWDFKSGQPLPLILLDLNMPRKDGHEALRELKAHPRLSKLPVVVFTTSGSEADIRAAYRLGAIRVARKPARFDELRKLLAALLPLPRAAAR